MGYAIFHQSKGKGNGNKLGAHIDRDDAQSQTFRSAESERRHLNRNVKLPNGYSEMKLEDAINARISSGYRGKRAIRKDAVRFISMVMTGSHREMKGIFSEKDLSQKWIMANLEFACREFGRDNIVRAALHLDEKTPHLHIVAVPLTEDGRLSANEVFGYVRKLSERLGRDPQAMKPFGLERGLKGSKSVHTSDIRHTTGQKEADMAVLSPLKQLSFPERTSTHNVMENTEKNRRADRDRNAEMNEETAALDVIGEVIAIKDFTDQVDAVMRAGRTLRPDGLGHEYPHELEAYYRRTKAEMARRIKDLAEHMGTSVEVVQGVCKNPRTIFRVLDHLENG